MPLRRHWRAKNLRLEPRKDLRMNTFGSQSELKAGGKSYEIFRLSALEKRGIDL
jgi:hypothetical protein